MPISRSKAPAHGSQAGTHKPLGVGSRLPIVFSWSEHLPGSRRLLAVLELHADLDRNSFSIFCRSSQVRPRSVEVSAVMDEFNDFMKTFGIVPATELVAEIAKWVKERNQCEGCRGTSSNHVPGIRLGSPAHTRRPVPAGFLPVERCDTCGIFETDVHAAIWLGGDVHIRRDPLNSDVIVQRPAF